MNLQERIAARREQQSAPQNSAPKQEPVQSEAKGQVINSAIIKGEQEHKQQFDAFKTAHGRHATSEKEFDQWQAKQQQEPKQQAEAKGYDREWDVAMRKEVAAPVMKDNKPIVPDRQDALDRVASQRQEQAKQLDMDPTTKKHQLSR